MLTRAEFLPVSRCSWWFCWCRPASRLRGPGRFGLGDGSLGFFNDLVERLDVVDSQFAQLFAVDADVGGVQAGDQTVVAQALGAASDVDAGDPQFAEFALLLFAINKGVAFGLLDRFHGAAVLLAAAWVKPLARFMTLLRFWVCAGPLVVRMVCSPVRIYEDNPERPFGYLIICQPSILVGKVTWQCFRGRGLVFRSSWRWVWLTVGVAQNVRDVP